MNSIKKKTDYPGFFVMLIFFIALSTTFISKPAQAHKCGPTSIEFNLAAIESLDIASAFFGEPLTSWNITSDQSEPGNTIYTLLSSDSSEVTVVPAGSFSAVNASYSFFWHGQSASKTTFIFKWEYPPENASGTCTVEVIVGFFANLTRLNTSHTGSGTEPQGTISGGVLVNGSSTVSNMPTVGPGDTILPVFEVQLTDDSFGTDVNNYTVCCLRPRGAGCHSSVT